MQYDMNQVLRYDYLFLYRDSVENLISFTNLICRLFIQFDFCDITFIDK